MKNVVALVLAALCTLSNADDKKGNPLYIPLWEELEKMAKEDLEKLEKRAKAIEDSYRAAKATYDKKKEEGDKDKGLAKMSSYKKELEKLKAAVDKDEKDNEQNIRDTKASEDRIKELADLREGKSDKTLNDALNKIKLDHKFDDVKFMNLDNQAKLNLLQRKLDQTVMGAYVREKVAAAIANTLCNKEDLCKAANGAELRKKIDEAMDSQYFNSAGGTGRLKEDNSNHK